MRVAEEGHEVSKRAAEPVYRYLPWSDELSIS
jgi:hypothetical protein